MGMVAPQSHGVEPTVMGGFTQEAVDGIMYALLDPQQNPQLVTGTTKAKRTTYNTMAAQSKEAGDSEERELTPPTPMPTLADQFQQIIHHANCRIQENAPITREEGTEAYSNSCIHFRWVA